jgi:Rrf2 family transcriptional regulator, iron-sulfur cluster assembly transcription factor
MAPNSIAVYYGTMRPSFHRRTDLALRAFHTIGAGPEPVTGSELAARIGTTLSFLPQVMAPLIRGGWVSSERGPGGGYRLTRTAAAATVLDVVESTEGPSDDGGCVLFDGPCPGSPACPVHQTWMEARRVLVDGLGRVPALADDITTKE